MSAIEAGATNDAKPLPRMLVGTCMTQPGLSRVAEVQTMSFHEGGECGVAGYERALRASLTRSTTVATSPASSTAASTR